LLSALSQLDASVHLAIAGHTGQKERYQRIVSQLGLGQRVHFLGSLPDLTPAYYSADLMAHPTLEDSYGMVVLDAMAHRLPVIVSNADYCGISRELMHLHNALLLHDPHDSQELAEALRSLLSFDKDTLHCLKTHAYEFAALRTWQVAAIRYEALYQSAAAGEAS
jgi:UDP-glucose:(heptosyl)LPS alpha-1,3-glucosyltransferase